MPAKFEDDLIWVAADTPLSDSAFLSNKIKDLCGDLPIFWLRPTYSTSKQFHGSMERFESVNLKVKKSVCKAFSQNKVGEGQMVSSIPI